MAAKRQQAERTTGRGTFVPLVFTASEAFQFDWSEDWSCHCRRVHQSAGGAHQAQPHPDKTAVIQRLRSVLGVPAPSNVWLYLNKGTHEEANRDDYDPNLVRTIVESLEALDALPLKAMPAIVADAAQAAATAAALALPQGRR